MKAYIMVEHGHYELNVNVIIAENYDKALELSEEARVSTDSYCFVDEIVIDEEQVIPVAQYIE